MRRKRKKLAQVARLQARGQLHIPSQGTTDEPEAEFDAALVAFGLQQGDPDDSAPPADKCYLWPCNLLTFDLWQHLQTQWRVGGMGDRTGLDYAGVTAYLREVRRIGPKALTELFKGLQAMELATLEAWAEKTEK